MSNNTNFQGGLFANTEIRMTNGVGYDLSGIKDAREHGITIKVCSIDENNKPQSSDVTEIREMGTTSKSVVMGVKGDWRKVRGVPEQTVKMVDGSVKMIKDLVVGDEILYGFYEYYNNRYYHNNTVAVTSLEILEHDPEPVYQIVLENESNNVIAECGAVVFVK